MVGTWRGGAVLNQSIEVRVLWEDAVKDRRKTLQKLKSVIRGQMVIFSIAVTPWKGKAGAGLLIK